MKGENIEEIGFLSPRKRSRPERYLRDRFLTPADLRKIRRKIGPWSELVRHPRALLWMAKGCQNGLLYQLSERSLRTLSEEMCSLRIKRGWNLRTYFQIAAVTNRLAKIQHEQAEGLYLLKAQALNEALHLAHHTRDTRLQWRLQIDCITIHFFEMDMIAGELDEISFHIPASEIEHLPHLVCP